MDPSDAMHNPSLLSPTVMVSGESLGLATARLVLILKEGGQLLSSARSPLDVRRTTLYQNPGLLLSHNVNNELNILRVLRIILVILPEILSGFHSSEDGNLLEPNPNKLMVERFDTSAGNPVKEILLKLNLPDHRSILTDSKVTPTKHRRMTKPYSPPTLLLTVLFQEYVKMVMEVFKITFSHSSQDKATSSHLKSMITTSNHKLMIEVKDYELKTEVKA
ncbi:hypothetical protein Tco_1229387 [Tanacetum coccineum]